MNSERIYIMIALAQFMDTITRARNCPSWNGATTTGTGQQNLNGIGGMLPHQWKCLTFPRHCEKNTRNPIRGYKKEGDITNPPRCGNTKGAKISITQYTQM